MRLLRNWYLIQTAATDPRAQRKVFDDELMGQLVRFVASHEVGHTLGLRHNMGASSKTPVEKLRDKKWLAENSNSPSIMDYAGLIMLPAGRWYYDFIPRIGDYDVWAIKWGYSYFADAENANKEKQLLNTLTKSHEESKTRVWHRNKPLQSKVSDRRPGGQCNESLRIRD